MSKTRVFIYGSCVSRDTFEHLDPEQFELVEYVARQSVLSATTRSVETLAPPVLESRFQQRMVTGDFQSSLRPLLAQHAADIDVLLVDLTDERLGAYLLPDGTVVTRSVELIESGVEQALPSGTRHVAFGTQQHYEYWTGAVQALGESIRSTMPRVAVALLDIPWAEWSESGQPTPDSFGVGAAQANPVFSSYVRAAAQALGAHTISLGPAEVLSGPHHPWGDAPFHYSENVYLEIVRRLTGAEGRVVWGLPSSPSQTGSQPNVGDPSASTPRRPVSTHSEITPSRESLVANQVAAIHAIMKDALPGRWREHRVSVQGPSSVHEFALGENTFMFEIAIKGGICDVRFLPRDQVQPATFTQQLDSLGIGWSEVEGKRDRVSIANEPIPNGIVTDKWVRELRNKINVIRESFENPPAYQAKRIVANQVAAIHSLMAQALPGRWRKHWIWTQGPASVHEFDSAENIFAFDITIQHNVCDVQFFPRDKSQVDSFMQRIDSLGIEWFGVEGKTDRVSIAASSIPDGIVTDDWAQGLRDRISQVRELFEAPAEGANGASGSF